MSSQFIVQNVKRMTATFVHPLCDIQTLFMCAVLLILMTYVCMYLMPDEIGANNINIFIVKGLHMSEP